MDGRGGGTIDRQKGGRWTLEPNASFTVPYPNHHLRFAKGLAMTTHRHQPQPGAIRDWSSLSRADEVEIYRQGKFIAAGRIDMLAPDGSMLWLHKDIGNDRTLFLESDDLQVYRRSRRSNSLRAC